MLGFLNGDRAWTTERGCFHQEWLMLEVSIPTRLEGRGKEVVARTFGILVGLHWLESQMRAKIGRKGEETRPLYKKGPNIILFELLFIFFFKEIHAEKERRGKHDNHVVAVKCKKIIWHNLKGFFFFVFFSKRQSTLLLKFTFLIKMPFDFQKDS